MKQKNSNSGSLKWDPEYGVSLIYTLENGTEQELLVEEAELLGLDIPPRSESFSSVSRAPKTKAQAIAEAKNHTESHGWKQPELKVSNKESEKSFDRYETNTWQKMLAQRNFLKRSARKKLLPQVKEDFSISDGAQGYYSSLLELTYVFDDYAWSVRTEKRLERMGEFAEIFRRYGAKDNDLADLSKKSLADFGVLIQELNEWSKIFGFPVFTVGVTNGLTKLLMDKNFTSWLRRRISKGLSEIDRKKIPEQIAVLCRSWKSYHKLG